MYKPRGVERTNKLERHYSTGGCNIDAMEWTNENYQYHKVTTAMKNILAQNDLIMKEIGDTFLADKKRQDGTSIESALDHMYVSRTKEGSATATKGEQNRLSPNPDNNKGHKKRG